LNLKIKISLLIGISTFQQTVTEHYLPPALSIQPGPRSWKRHEDIKRSTYYGYDS